MMTHDDLCEAWRETIKLIESQSLNDSPLWLYSKQYLFWFMPNVFENWFDEMQDRYGECDD